MHETKDFALSVAAVREGGAKAGLPLDVVDDRYDEALKGPGAAGHCGIIGLDSKEQRASRKVYRSAREGLASACRPLP